MLVGLRAEPSHEPPAVIQCCHDPVKREMDRPRLPGWVPPYGHLRELTSKPDAALSIGRRVLVTGMAGSGKSTFSRSLAAKTGLPVIHLDVHFWKPGWVAPSEGRLARCLMGATIPPGDGCAMNGVWPLSSVATAAQSPSANTRSFHSTGSTRPFTCSGPNGQLSTSWMGWTSRTTADVPAVAGVRQRRDL